VGVRFKVCVSVPDGIAGRARLSEILPDLSGFLESTETFELWREHEKQSSS
jgi:hypothetical protein